MERAQSSFKPKSRKIPKMSISSKLLPVIALAAALAPLAAHARSNSQPRPAHDYRAPPPHQDAQKHANIGNVMVGSDTIDSPSPYYRAASAGR
jgi:hypothetical protein